jgi:glycosyltransferase involved in cell wall biosynthesis
MKVVYFSKGYTPHDYRFLAKLAQTNHQVYFIRLENVRRQTEERPLPERIQAVEWAGGKQPFQWRNAPALALALRDVLARIGPHLVHAGPVQSAAFVTALAGFKPLVSMSWGSDMLLEAESSRWMRWVTRFTLSRTRLLVADCQAVRSKAEAFGFPAKRTILFPWGVDLGQFSPGPASELRTRLAWEFNFVLLSLRSWEPIYGVDVLARAFVRAARVIPELRLILLGGGSQAAVIHHILGQEGMIDRVYIGGHIPQNELPAYYRSADLYLSASHSDGSSISLLEALACGRPVLVSDIPGNREWINHGVNGWLFPDGDDAALAEGIRTAYRSSEILSIFGRGARIVAEQRADWGKNFKLLENAYEMVGKKS